MDVKKGSGLPGHSSGSTPQVVPAPALSSVTIPSVDSQDLFNGRREIGIVHDGIVYRLKITRQGKLILNK